MAFPPSLFPQYVQNKFAVGLRVGPNLWINDMNDRQVGMGGDVFVRYGVGKYFSPGIVANFEVLKAGQFPLQPPVFPVDYLKVTALSFAAIGWVYLAPGNNFSPYFYAGAGITLYSRKDGGGAPFPDQQFGKSSSPYIPFGVGFESFLSKNSAISFDLGYRGLNQQTENVSTGSPDAFLTMKLGATFFFGSNDDDDDDNDGLSNGKEAALGLDPNNPDTDGDGLTDGDEIFKYKTDPTKKDTDGDGLSDGDEIWRFRTDPLLADTDKDGLSDGDEVSVYNTDPLKVDTDKDGLSDGEEVLTYHTDPLKPDTDDDGLTDSSEIFGYKTDPLKADTDGGGVNDGTEVKQGTNPLKREDDKVEIGKRTQENPDFSRSAMGIRFNQNSMEFTRASEFFLAEVSETLSKNPQLQIEIGGYTDNRGSNEENYKLSLDRAAAVKQWLVNRGIAEGRMTVKGFGPEHPIASNRTA
ncbi:MAG: OmpA family protein, partial [bacterium]